MVSPQTLPSLAVSLDPFDFDVPLAAAIVSSGVQLVRQCRTLDCTHCAPCPTTPQAPASTHTPPEQMNLAWASHEIISDYLTPCLAWLEAGGQKPIDGLLRALQARRVWRRGVRSA